MKEIFVWNSATESNNVQTFILLFINISLLNKDLVLFGYSLFVQFTMNRVNSEQVCLIFHAFPPLHNNDSFAKYYKMINIENVCYALTVPSVCQARQADRVIANCGQIANGKYKYKY